MFLKKNKQNQVPYIWQTFFATLFILLLANCTEPPPPSLNCKDRQISDSLYRDSINYLKPLIDSLCELNFDKNVQETVDSIMTERLEEIRKQMKRIHGK